MTPETTGSLPQVVVEPVDVDDVLAALEVSRQTGTPVTSRGGGTSVAGNCHRTGHRHRLRPASQPGPRDRHGQPDGAGRAGCDPGAAADEAAPLGLRFGPDPSTHARATIAGMIGNNACGPHAVAYGRTADNVAALTMVDGSGRQFTAGRGLHAVPGLEALVDSHLDVIRTELGTFPRQVSGYSLGAPAAGEGPRPGEGTGRHRRHPRRHPRRHRQAGSGQPRPDAGRAGLSRHGDGRRRRARPAGALAALAVEGLDARLVDVVRRAQGRRRGAGAPPRRRLVDGRDRRRTAPRSPRPRPRRWSASAGALDARIMPAGPEATAMWRIREDGAGLAGRTPDGRQAWPGWEDAAVPPANLGAYLREFESLMVRLRCGRAAVRALRRRLHPRPDRPAAGPETARSSAHFILDAARLVVQHGGSCSGEHGDGRARSELLPIMYSERTLELFAGVKALFDPDNLLNPGVLVRPNAIDADLRRPQAEADAVDQRLQLRATTTGTSPRRCTAASGSASAGPTTAAAGGFMCPSYLASKDEKDVTRGRARVLQELTNGTLIADWSSREVHESLDLCLSCKACARDCPAGVDMAQYKSEVLHRTYRKRLRPISHYSVGWLPRWIWLLDRFPRIGPAVLNAALGFRPLAGSCCAPAASTPAAAAPKFAPTTFHRWWRSTTARPPPTTPATLWCCGPTASPTG